MEGDGVDVLYGVMLGYGVGVSVAMTTAVGFGGTVIVGPGQATTIATATRRVAASPATVPKRTLVLLNMT